MLRETTHAPALCALACLLILPGGQPVKVSEFAVPKAVVAGENVELQCHYELDAAEKESQVIVKWWWTPLNASLEQSKQLYQRIGSMPAQLVQPDLTSKEKDTIALADLQPEDSGVYECEVAALLGEARQHQALHVYTQGSGPEVNATLEEDEGSDGERDVVITCEARDVAPEPDLAITVDKQSQEIQQWVSAPDAGRYNVSANVTVSRDLADGAEIRCEMFYQDESISHPVFDSVILYEAEGGATTTEAALGTTESLAAAIADAGTEQDNAAGKLSGMPAIVGLCMLSMFRYFC